METNLDTEQLPPTRMPWLGKGKLPPGPKRHTPVDVRILFPDEFRGRELALDPQERDCRIFCRPTERTTHGCDWIALRASTRRANDPDRDAYRCVVHAEAVVAVAECGIVLRHGPSEGRASEKAKRDQRNAVLAGAKAAVKAMRAELKVLRRAVDVWDGQRSRLDHAVRQTRAQWNRAHVDYGRARAVDKARAGKRVAKWRDQLQLAEDALAAQDAAAPHAVTERIRELQADIEAVYREHPAARPRRR